MEISFWYTYSTNRVFDHVCTQKEKHIKKEARKHTKHEFAKILVLISWQSFYLNVCTYPWVFLLLWVDEHNQSGGQIGANDARRKLASVSVSTHCKTQFIKLVHQFLFPFAVSFKFLINVLVSEMARHACNTSLCHPGNFLFIWFSELKVQWKRRPIQQLSCVSLLLIHMKLCLVKLWRSSERWQTVCLNLLHKVDLW